MDYKKNIRIVFVIFAALFMSLSVWIISSVFFITKEIIYSPYNKRITADKYINRGSISDRTGLIIAETLSDKSRSYPFGTVFSHPIGFSGVHAQGIEHSNQAELIHTSYEFRQRMNSLFIGAPVMGDSIKTTFDYRLQQKAMELLDEYNGAIIVMESSSGKILALASSPSFNPVGATAHGDVDYLSAMAKSCNGYFAAIAEMIGANALNATANELLFNTFLPIGLDHSQSIFSAVSADLAESSIGQGKVLATPLHVCLIMSAIANDGVMQKPIYILEHQNYAGKTIKTINTEYYDTLFSKEERDILKDVCREVVVTGTASRLSDTMIAGKTGTAELSGGESHGWFAGFTPYDDPEIAFVILIENIGSSSALLPIVREITDFFTTLQQ